MGLKADKFFLLNIFFPLQCCVGFHCATVRISHSSTHTLSPRASLLSPHPSRLGHHRVPGWAPCVIQQVPRSCLFCTRACVYVNAAFSVRPTLYFPHCVRKSVLCICEDRKALKFFLGVCVEVICKNQFLEGWQCWLASCQQSGRPAWPKASEGWLDIRVDRSGLLVLFP